MSFGENVKGHENKIRQDQTVNKKQFFFHMCSTAIMTTLWQ